MEPQRANSSGASFPGKIRKLKANCSHYLKRAVIILDKHYAIDGLTTMIKVIVPSMTLFDKLRGTNHFSHTKRDLEPLKNLYYATSFIGTFNEGFVKRDQKGNIKGFKIPQYKGGADYAKILNLIGDVSETGRFIQKQRLHFFKLLCHLGHKYGSLRFLPDLQGGWVHVKQIPYLNCLVTKPKDFFVLSSCLVKLYRFSGLEREEKKEWDKMLELANTTGKIGLIIAGPFIASSKNWTGLGFAVLDLVTNTIGASRAIKKMDLSKV